MPSKKILVSSNPKLAKDIRYHLLEEIDKSFGQKLRVKMKGREEYIQI